MSDNTANPTPQPQGQYRTETVVEVVDNSRQRRVLAIVLVLLLFLLGIAGFFVWKVSKPAGAPASRVAADGMEWVRSIYGWGKSPNQMLTDPTDAAVGPDGTIWTISNKTTLAGFNSDGTVVKVVPYQRGGKPGMVGSIEGLDVDEDGNIYMADFGLNKIQVADSNGKIIRSWDVQLPTEVAVKDGKVAVAAAYGIGVFDTNGTLISKWGSQGTGKDQVDLPHGITWGQDGNIYVSDTQNKRIKAYNPEGRLLFIAPKGQEEATRLKSMGQTKNSKESSQTPYQLPAGMTTDAAGRIVLVDPFEFTIMAQNPKNGAITGTYGTFGRGDGQFAYPTGIDYDAQRDYYVVADTTNNRLQIVRLPDSGGNAVTGNLRRVLDGPFWVLLIPFILLIVALFIALARRGKKGKKGTSVPQTPAPSAQG